MSLIAWLVVMRQRAPRAALRFCGGSRRASPRRNASRWLPSTSIRKNAPNAGQPQPGGEPQRTPCTRTRRSACAAGRPRVKPHMFVCRCARETATAPRTRWARHSSAPQHFGLLAFDASPLLSSRTSLCRQQLLRASAAVGIEALKAERMHIHVCAHVCAQVCTSCAQVCTHVCVCVCALSVKAHDCGCPARLALVGQELLGCRSIAETAIHMPLGGKDSPRLFGRATLHSVVPVVQGPSGAPGP